MKAAKKGGIELRTQSSDAVQTYIHSTYTSIWLPFGMDNLHTYILNLHLFIFVLYQCCNVGVDYLCMFFIHDHCHASIKYCQVTKPT